MKTFLTAREIARICHTANNELCRVLGDPIAPDFLLVTPEHKEGLEAGVRAIIEKPDTTPEEIHARWVESVRADGWVYAPRMNRDKKEHPCLVEWEKVPTEQRYKDVLFIAIVRALAIE